jgi:hypothetical protein
MLTTVGDTDMFANGMPTRLHTSRRRHGWPLLPPSVAATMSAAAKVPPGLRTRLASRKKAARVRKWYAESTF